MPFPVKKITILGLFTSLALILSYIEHLIPITPGIPGIKLGLPNFLILVLLYTYDWKEAGIVNMSRILLSGFLFGNLFSIIYSLSGAFLSFIIMILCKKAKIFTMTGISILGGVFHNIGQLVVACILVEGFSMFAYTPVLLISGLFTGMANGFLAGQIYKRGIL